MKKKNQKTREKTFSLLKMAIFSMKVNNLYKSCYLYKNSAISWRKKIS